MRYLVYACEKTHHGKDGLENWEVYEVDDSLTEIDMYNYCVYPMAAEIINSHDELKNNLIDRNKYDNENDYWDAYEKELYNNIEGYVVKIRNDVTLSMFELDEEAYKLGAEAFKKLYCE